jgi:hypothetical protein
MQWWNEKWRLPLSVHIHPHQSCECAQFSMLTASTMNENEKRKFEFIVNMELMFEYTAMIRVELSQMRIDPRQSTSIEI